MLVILGGISIAFLLLVIALRLQYVRRRGYDALLVQKWEPLVMDYLADEAKPGDIAKAIGDSRHAKDLFSSMISDYLINLRGEEHASLVDLVNKIGLAEHEIAALRARAPWRRAIAALHLRLIGDAKAIPALREGLYDTSPVVQVTCADSLANLGDLGAVETVAGILLTQTEWNRVKTADILVLYGRLAAYRLEPFAFDESIEPDRRALVIEVLGTVGYRACATKLLHLAQQSSDPRITTAVVKYIGLTTNFEGLPFLTGRLEDEDWLVRSQAAKSLGKIGDPVVVPRLQELMRDSVWWVRYQAATALAVIMPEGLLALEDMADADSDHFARDMAKQALYEAGEWGELAA